MAAVSITLGVLFMAPLGIYLLRLIRFAKWRATDRAKALADGCGVCGAPVTKVSWTRLPRDRWFSAPAAETHGWCDDHYALFRKQFHRSTTE